MAKSPNRRGGSERPGAADQKRRRSAAGAEYWEPWSGAGGAKPAAARLQEERPAWQWPELVRGAARVAQQKLDEREAFAERLPAFRRPEPEAAARLTSQETRGKGLY